MHILYIELRSGVPGCIVCGKQQSNSRESSIDPKGCSRNGAEAS